uniref:NADH-ubiquinone oxidoreductase chain 3 n=1 Tax=Terebratalia transversa TaxID=34513 RepID=Q953W8_TERTR|nr:NADH dehydrogenase subunit 3 [Terebratalia transversa]AAK95508.1 NADH dehydrogenase subunit 3 [Terebratalia transversa]
MYLGVWILSALIPVLLYLVSYLIGFKVVFSRYKSSPFECGFDPSESSRVPFSFRFFLMAVIFLVFDVELALIMPIPFVLGGTGWFYYFWLGGFFLILWGGTVYEWGEGALDWMI